jgi:predicted AAA+ superfamily ATPase
MFERTIKKKLKKALLRSPVVLVNGARQCGKTTLAQEVGLEEKYSYTTFDNELIYLAAQGNMPSFIEGLEKPVIIDEIQRIPEIFRTIKLDVDNNRKAGRYLLTGSANPLLLPRLGDSLAGRMEIIDLMPLSQGEIAGIEERFIDLIFSDKNLRKPKNLVSKQELYSKILTGGYPTVQNMNEEDRTEWIHSYISLLLQRDIRDLAEIEKLVEFPNLLKILAGRASGLLNIADLSRESKIHSKTLGRYFSLLITVFIINEQLSWHNNIIKRYVKSPKIYFVDTGLLSYFLDINLERALKDNMLMGRLLENFVVTELKKQATWSTTKVQSYHFRTTSSEEVDIILENRSGDIIGIEIKNSEMVSGQDFKGLKYLKKELGNRFIKGIILYTGSEYLKHAENLYMMPVHALWEDYSDLF